ncbi:hypothetical protein Y900_025510 [Mycolicibacterium aromaticivorans JS19b1 = JCM 16368]|uniref:Uncharacterized protein n=1 Tax=Mycolicibacterium aromaticivorans JS19b1 = JCM 16368 TaxID=1440774 RepID=A0A064CTQ7_9MYCO|nr:hypothetical protein Y900_025510 [Mycolicibacterium aromaticivorans JS19b1 = JCM 16368]
MDAYSDDLVRHAACMGACIGCFEEPPSAFADIGAESTCRAGRRQMPRGDVVNGLDYWQEFGRLRLRPPGWLRRRICAAIGWQHNAFVLRQRQINVWQRTFSARPRRRSTPR